MNSRWNLGKCHFSAHVFAAIGCFWLGVSGIGTPRASAQITIQTVPIGHPDNDTDPFTGGIYGSVAYVYSIGTFEVTNSQYATFLNAVASTDTNNLYSIHMAESFGGIARSGSSGSYTYTTMSGRENNPVNFVTYWDACRFANWLHNRQPTGAQDNTTTEDGAYTLTPDGMSTNTITRNADWRWALTSEDEWYKAAYHQPADQGGDADGYWLYPTSSNIAPTPTEANYRNSGFNNTTPVGSYAANFYRTFDMGGNLWEWNEAIITESDRGRRGGSFVHFVSSMESDIRNKRDPSIESYGVGFRVSRVPCQADFNRDGFVNDDDYELFVYFFETGDIVADYNGDGFVNGDDYDEFAAAFEQGC